MNATNATVVISTALLLGALHPLSFASPLIAQATESVSRSAHPQPSTAKGNSETSAGTNEAGGEKVEKNLKHCLSQIPADSSSGQRLLAEQSCRKEHEVRSARHSAPEF